MLRNRMRTLVNEELDNISRKCLEIKEYIEQNGRFAKEQKEICERENVAVKEVLIILLFLR